MVYVANGQVLDSRTQSPWRLSFLADLFWGAVEFIGLFFQTLVQPDLSKDGRSGSSSRSSDGRGPPGPPGGRRRMGRINHGAGPSAPPMGGGG
ncbi:selenoprotein K [Aplochiton taeniatus]